MSISIANIDKAKIFVALYKAARVRNAFQHYATISYGTAVQLLERKLNYGIFEGKAMYIDLSSDTLNVSVYDQHNGKNSALFALNDLIQEAARKQESDSIKRSIPMSRQPKPPRQMYKPVPPATPIPPTMQSTKRNTQPNHPTLRSIIRNKNINNKNTNNKNINARTAVNIRNAQKNNVRQNNSIKENPPEPTIEIDEYKMVNPERINQLEAIIKYEQEKLSRQQKRIDIFERFAGLARDLDRLEYEENMANLKNPMIENTNTIKEIEYRVDSIKLDNVNLNNVKTDDIKTNDIKIDNSIIESISVSEIPNIHIPISHVNNLRTKSTQSDSSSYQPPTIISSSCSPNLPCSSNLTNLNDDDSDSISEINTSLFGRVLNNIENNTIENPDNIENSNIGNPIIENPKNEIDNLFKALNSIQHKNIEEVANHILMTEVQETNKIKTKLELQREHFMKERGIPIDRKY